MGDIGSVDCERTVSSRSLSCSLTHTQRSALELRRGEIKIDSINSVEDTKGNNGERGSLSITNLRLMWVAHRHSRTNLS